jgi:hypothetical protein
MITLLKQVPGGFEPVASFAGDLASALAAAETFDGWQIEEATEIGVRIVETRLSGHLSGAGAA